MGDQLAGTTWVQVTPPLWAISTKISENTLETFTNFVKEFVRSSLTLLRMAYVVSDSFAGDVCDNKEESVQKGRVEAQRTSEFFFKSTLKQQTAATVVQPDAPILPYWQENGHCSTEIGQ